LFVLGVSLTDNPYGTFSIYNFAVFANWFN